MNCTVRFGKQFSESSPCLPGQQGTGQQGWYASGTLRKQFTKPTVKFILGRSIQPGKSFLGIPRIPEWLLLSRRTLKVLLVLPRGLITISRSFCTWAALRPLGGLLSFAQQTANQYENRSALALCTWIVREKPVVALFGPAGVGLGACPARSLEDTREMTDLTESEGRKEQQKGERERERPP